MILSLVARLTLLLQGLQDMSREFEMSMMGTPRHTPDFGLWYSASSSLALHGCSDADFARSRLDRKSTSGTCQFLGSSLVYWSAHKQSSVAQSTTEAEYVATASCCYQLLWITYTMSDFGEEYTHVPLQCDSTSAISVAKNPVLHSKTKHIEVRYHFLRDIIEEGKITLIHVPTHDQLADIFTKPLDQATFTCLRGELVCVCFLELVCGSSFVAYV
jgi:hypothetical protein